VKLVQVGHDVDGRKILSFLVPKKAKIKKAKIKRATGGSK
jgi:hypothetical protein